MITQVPAAVNLPLVLLGLAMGGCEADAPAQRPTPARSPGEMGLPAETARTAVDRGPANGIVTARLPGNPRIGGHVGELSAPVKVALGESWTPLQEIGAHLTDAEPGGGGEALLAALDELPKRRVDQYGVSALTLEQLFGDTFHPGLCEDAELLLDTEFDGDRWEMSLSVPSYMAFVNDPAPYTSTLAEACQDALTASGGDLAAAQESGCIEDDIHQFFEAGTPCRACVEGNGGDFASCVDLGECPAEAAIQVWIDEPEGPVWYDVATAEMWACAPAETVLTLLLTDIPASGALPAAFDHEAWAYLCLPYWDESIDDTSYTCLSGEGGPKLGDALLEGMVGRVNWMHPKKDDSVDFHTNLQYWVDGIELQSGAEISWFWGFSTGAGVFSMPSYEPDSDGDGSYDLDDENYGYPLGGWGINPYALRPDGTDPTRVGDTLARDWVGTMAIKFSTTRDGVPISVANHSRCLSWSGETDDGSLRCLEMGPPVYGWQNDVQNTWWDSSFTQAYPFPVTTLGSTGLPDSKVPGDVVALVAGTPTLGDPDWDDCAWPDTFVPDRAPMEDTPADYGGPASLWADTWRFGKSGGLDLRAVLYTNQARDFCPEEAQ